MQTRMYAACAATSGLRNARGPQMARMYATCAYKMISLFEHKKYNKTQPRICAACAVTRGLRSARDPPMSRMYAACA